MNDLMVSLLYVYCNHLNANRRLFIDGLTRVVELTMHA